jgi:predicted CoA-binding protein
MRNIVIRVQARNKVLIQELLSKTNLRLVSDPVIRQAIAAGVKNIWMQPGAEDSEGSQAARDAGLNVIDDGSCILILLSIEQSSK